MGWFWADSPSTSSSAKLAPPPNHPTSGTPPPSCPMHRTPAARATPSACPYTPPDSTPSSSEPPAENTGTGSLNPLNFMFSSLPQTRHKDQKVALPTDREVSSIPKADGTAWEYPSPQQMYNAMRRKGYDGKDEEAVPSMVAVHNFLNEGAWSEICEWEKRFGGGALKALKGEEGEGVREGWPRLERFQGRSRDLTPKARMLGMLGRVWPEKFGGEPPFDRHDWYVLRQVPGETEPRTVRYVIDYYSAPPEPSGQPVFYLDVRPAVDRPGAVMERVVRWGGDVWEKASGADVRRREMAEKLQKENGL